MPKSQLSDITVSRMALIFEKGANGEQWAPRNQDAVFQAVKGGPTDTIKGRSTYDLLVEKFGAERAAVAKGLWIKDGTPDGVDGDNDGAQDYEQILSVMFGAGQIAGGPSIYGWDWYCSQGGFYGDLQRAMNIQDIDMRSAAISIGIDQLLAALDDIRSGGDGVKKAAAIDAYKNGPAAAVDKAGARHSKADVAKLDKIKEHADAIGALHGELTKNDASPADDAKPDDGKTDKGGAVEPPASAPPAPTTAVPAAAAKGDAALTGTLTLADGSTVELKDGAVVDKAAPAPEHQPAAAPAFDAQALVQTLTETVKGQLDAHAQTVKADVAAQVTALGTSLDAKIADVAKAGNADLAENVRLMKAAQAATSPGASGAVDVNGMHTGGPLDGRATASAPLPANATVRDVLASTSTVQA